MPAATTTFGGLGAAAAPAATAFGQPTIGFGLGAAASSLAFDAGAGAFGAAGGGGMFGAPATPAFGAAPSQFGAPAPGGMFGAAPAAAAPATGGSFGSTGGRMFGQRAPAPTFGALGAPAAFDSTSGGFGFGAPQVRAPSTPPRSLARSQPLHTDRLSCAVLSSVCDPWRKVMQSQPSAKIGGFGASSAPSLFGAAPSNNQSGAVARGFSTAGGRKAVPYASAMKRAESMMQAVEHHDGSGSPSKRASLGGVGVAAGAGAAACESETAGASGPANGSAVDRPISSLLS